MRRPDLAWPGMVGARGPNGQYSNSPEQVVVVPSSSVRRRARGMRGLLPRHAGWRRIPAAVAARGLAALSGARRRRDQPRCRGALPTAASAAADGLG